MATIYPAGGVVWNGCLSPVSSVSDGYGFRPRPLIARNFFAMNTAPTRQLPGQTPKPAACWSWYIRTVFAPDVGDSATRRLGHAARHRHPPCVRATPVFPASQFRSDKQPRLVRQWQGTNRSAFTQTQSANTVARPIAAGFLSRGASAFH